MSGGDQFEQQSVRIDEANAFLIEAPKFFYGNHSLLFQSVVPIADRLRRDCETGRNYLASAARAAPRAGPWEKCDDCSRPSGPVAEIQMIRARIVEVDRAFHEPQAKDLGIKIEIALRIGRDRSDMMNTEKFHRDLVTHVFVEKASRGALVDRE